MDSYVAKNVQGQGVLLPPRRNPSLIKALIVTLPIVIYLLDKDCYSKFYWQTVCVAAFMILASPLSFPYMNVDLGEQDLPEKIGKWIASRIDIAIKKWIFALILTFILTSVLSIPIYKIVVMFHFFKMYEDFLWPLPEYFIVLANISLILRAFVFFSVSSVIPYIVVPIGGLLLGYLMELGAIIINGNTSFSIMIACVIVFDLVSFVVVRGHDSLVQ